MSKVINGQEYQNPLEDEPFMAKLVGLEEAFYKGKTTPDVIGELCLLYADLVQYYDFKKDVIANYFLERIHIVSCAQLYSRGPLLAKANDSPTTKLSPEQKTKSQMPLEELIDLEQKTFKHLIEQKPWNKNMSFDERKVQRQKTAILRNKLEEENQRICDNIPLKIVEMTGQMKQIDTVITTNLQSQEERIREKLEERKRNSFAKSTTLSNTSFAQPGGDSKENSIVYGLSSGATLDEKLKATAHPRHRDSLDLGILKPLDNILEGLNQLPLLRDRMFSR